MPTATLSSVPSRPVRTRSRVWSVLAGVWGAFVGAAPHVLHHVGPLAGAAFLAGTTGKLAFGVAGLALSVPMLLRVRRRCSSWTVPVLLLAAFAGVWAVSTFVIVPAITGTGSSDPTSSSQTSNDGAPGSHDGHHPVDGSPAP